MAPTPSTSINGDPSVTVKTMEESRISPPLLASQALPLTFLDIPWLQFPPLQPLFFFQLPPMENAYSEFCSTILPRLKSSLSSALGHFFPYLGKLSESNPDNLVFSTDNRNESSASDSVLLSVALCDARINELCNYLPKSANQFRLLVPSLPFISLSELSSNPATLFAVQITYFPAYPSGFSIGIALHPVLCDQRTLNNFLHLWASLSKFGKGNGNTNENDIGIDISFDRSVILDRTELKPDLLNQIKSVIKKLPGPTSNGLVRSTFVMGPTDISNATKWVRTMCNDLGRPCPVVLSPYVVTCALLWCCYLRARVLNICSTKAKTKGPMYFGFIAGGLTRVPFKVPGNYFGNCVGFGQAVADREELMEPDGILVAADAIAQTIKELGSDLLEGAEKWIPEWERIIGSDDHVHVVGSPKVKLYDMDFGWGKVKKIEEISIDVSKGVSLTESRDLKGGIEIGVTLTNCVMDAFSALFSEGVAMFAL